MSYKIKLFVLVVTLLFGCKSIGSRMYSESEDKVLYTRGDNTRGVDHPLDNDSAYLFTNALDIPRESFPDVGGNFPEIDQTKEEILANISNVIGRMSEGETLWWYLQGHGLENEFYTAGGQVYVTYDELFEHMAKQLELNPNIDRIKRLVILILSCYSGSIIPTIKKYQGIVYDEVIAFTPVTAGQPAYIYSVFPELVNSAIFFKISHNDTTLVKTEDVIVKVKETLDNQNHYPFKFDNNETDYTTKISFSSEEPKTTQDSNNNSESNDTGSNTPSLQLSSRQDPTWKDLLDLTIWLFKSYNYHNYHQDPQVFTYPPELANECIFSKVDKKSSCIERSR